MPITSNFDGFIKEFDLDSTKVFDKADDKVADAIRLLFNSIIIKTPTDSGYLRGNWHVSLGSDSARVYGSKDAPRAVGSAINEANSKLSKFNSKAITSAYIVNNVEYGPVAEYGGWKGPTAKVTGSGFSRKAPNGMVRISLTDFELFLRRAS